MKKITVLLLLLLLLVPVYAQDMDPCDLDPPESAAEVNFIGVAFPLIEFMADEPGKMQRC